LCWAGAPALNINLADSEMFLDLLLELFGKCVAFLVVLLIGIILCLLVCGIALIPIISVLYLFTDWFSKEEKRN
jgi:hypothetical protein